MRMPRCRSCLSAEPSADLPPIFTISFNQPNPLFMPAITSGKVLVTGANGYIASWLVRKLLDQGFSVRGSVRSAAKGDIVKNTFKDYGERLEVVVVEDIAMVVEPTLCTSTLI